MRGASCDWTILFHSASHSLQTVAVSDLPVPQLAKHITLSRQTKFTVCKLWRCGLAKWQCLSDRT